jgi:hypothetical protein
MADAAGTGGDVRRSASAGAMPRALRIGIAAAVALLLAGAALLIAGRGEALLIDLYAAGRQFLCL